ncbi:Gfo/Idh/MocA family oxidoreductase [Litorivicinus sp.]|nr:Gfo/Idh/MocA family oxidoreductase [Litorivicinus sp.]
MSVWLIGAGEMAQDYARVFHGLRVEFQVIGRGTHSASTFEQATGHSPRTGGLTDALKAEKAPEKAIIAVGIEQLAATTSELIRAGTKRILVEKPAGLNLTEVGRLNQIAEEYGAEVLIAYNRRFYNSVGQARQLIDEDQGVLSAQFEFTEWSHIIKPLVKGAGVKEHWVLGNSTHVIDLAFHLIGKPINWSSWHAGTIEWHPTSARFAGAGITDRGVMFSYLSDWQAPGRWGLELMTAKRRLILRPMERLQVVKLGSVAVESIETMDTLDGDFKPGLYQQTNAFLNGDDALFCSLGEQVGNVSIYSRMAGYV